MNLITKFPHFCQYLCLLTVNSCGVFEWGVFQKAKKYHPDKQYTFFKQKNKQYILRKINLKTEKKLILQKPRDENLLSKLPSYLVICKIFVTYICHL